MKAEEISLEYDPSLDHEYQLSPLEVLGYYWFKLINPNYLDQYYKNCLVQSLVRDLRSKKCRFYDTNKKTLTPQFAQTLFQMLQSADELRKMFQHSYYSISITPSVDDNTHILPIERIFHAYYTNEEIQQYPLLYPNIVSKIKNQKITEIGKIIDRLISSYTVDIPEDKKEFFDQHCHRVRHIAKLHSEQYLEFLQRFDPYISFEKNNDANEKRSWYPVTMSAVVPILERLCTFLENCIFTEVDFQIITEVNKSLRNTGSKFALSDERLKELWDNFYTAVQKFKKNNQMETLLKIAFQRQQVPIQKHFSMMSAYQIFETNIRFRGSQLSLQLIQDALEKRIDRATDLFSPFRINNVEGKIGIYNANYQKKFSAHVSNAFRYQAAFMPIAYFVIHYADPWIKRFFVSVFSQAQFAHEKDKRRLEKASRYLNRFLDIYYKFVFHVQNDQHTVQEVLSVLMQDKLTQTDYETIENFVQGVDAQAKVVLDQFKPIILFVEYMALSITRDLAHKKNMYITNVSEMAGIFTEDNCNKLLQLIEFCSETKVVMDIVQAQDSELFKEVALV